MRQRYVLEYFFSEAMRSLFFYSKIGIIVKNDVFYETEISAQDD